MFQLAPRRRALAVIVPLSLLAGTTHAQEELCFTDSIPLQPTNFINQSVEVSKFDPELGILSGIEFTLVGMAEGSAGVESLDASPTTVMTQFEATLTLTRPDTSEIVVTTPLAMFTDDLSAFDGIIDFRGTSGITRTGIQAMDSDSAISPPPASDIALFTGPAGNPGTIVLPVTGIGTSSASGSGNVITQFMTSASADVEVCYIYELDCNDNGIPDRIDIIDGTSEDCNNNDIPDECEIDPGIIFCFGNGCPCANDDPMAGCANSTGSGARLIGSGTASIGLDNLMLDLSGAVPDEVTMLFSADFALNACSGRFFGDGLRCVGQNSLRLVSTNADFNGDATYGPGLIALEDNATAGLTRNYQVWYRDLQGPCGTGFNLSNGFGVIFVP